MPKIRIDTGRVRDVGRQLSAEGNSLEEIGNELQRVIDSLDTWAWDGHSRAKAQPMLDRVRPESVRVSDTLDVLGRKLLKVADIFEQEDSTAAQKLGEMPWVSFDISVTEVTLASPDENKDAQVKPWEKWEEWKDIVEVGKEGYEQFYEQFKDGMKSIDIVDEYVIDVLYYQDDAVEILSVSEEWTRWTRPVKSGWAKFGDDLGLGSSKLPLISCAIDMGLTTWEYWDDGLFSNTEYYAALATDLLLFIGGAAIGTAIGALGLVGAPAVLATIGASIAWGFVSDEWLEDFLQDSVVTPIFEWAGDQLDAAWHGVQTVASDVGEWTSDALDWTENAVDEAAGWVSNKIGGFVDDLIPAWSW